MTRVHEILGNVLRAPSATRPQIDDFDLTVPPAIPDVLVIHDANRDFRHFDPQHALIPFIGVDGPKPRAIVLQMHGPLPAFGNVNVSEKSQLWEELAKNSLDRLIIVLKYSSLIQSGVNLNVAQSFERAADEFLASMTCSPLSHLTAARHLVVQFPQGVLHYDRKRTALHIEMLNSPYLFPYDEREGSVPGRSMLLVAAIVQGLTTLGDPDPDQIINKSIPGALQRSLLWTYLHDESGLGAWDGELLKTINQRKWIEDLFTKAEGFEDLIEDLITKGSGGGPLTLSKFRGWPVLGTEWPFGRIDVPIKRHPFKPWSRLDGFAEEYHRLDNSTSTMVGQQILQKGLNAVVKEWLERNFANSVNAGSAGPYTLYSSPCPYLRFGDLIAADRDELDAYLGIYGLMRRYLGDRSSKKPLSLAVFGPPGSGKSFVVREIMKAAVNNTGQNVREFNIAQFLTPQDLSLVFHKAQDLAVGATVPLILLDEFDSICENREFGWLKYFLAPMQDGQFKFGESMYTVGKAIFVFAGGVSESYNRFRERTVDHSLSTSKARDFVSRLRGHLDIRGISAEPGVEVSTALKFRRAIILREQIRKALPAVWNDDTKELRIDSSVSQAFLETRAYTHDVRSMEAIIQMARVSPPGSRFQRSWIPAREQLAMHVDADEFLRLLS